MSWQADVDRSLIRDVIGNVRETLIDEFERQLDKYGLYDDDYLSYAQINHLSAEGLATRQELDQALLREAASYQQTQEWDRDPETPDPSAESPLTAVAGEYERAYENYVFETAKVTTIQLLGQLILEHRGLTSHSLLTSLDDAEQPRVPGTVDEIARELGESTARSVPTAIELQYRERAVELPFVYGPNQYTILSPEFTVLREVVDELRRLNEIENNHFTLDVLLGWVYQYFGDERRDDLADAVNNDTHKLASGELATSTQRFTPRYIVEWLIDNSLGRTWFESGNHSTTAIDSTNPGTTCRYLAPHPHGLVDRDGGDPVEVTVLDPACGGGHILLYAFDVLVEWYEEAYPEWSDEEIVSSILQSNLYGIELDPGAARLATLALYTKAKTKTPDAEISRINVYATGGIEITETQADAIRTEARDVFGFEPAFLDRIIRTFHHLTNRGSLVNPETILEDAAEDQQVVNALGEAAGAGLRGTSEGDADDVDDAARHKAALLEQLQEIFTNALESRGERTGDTPEFNSLYQSGIETGIELLGLLDNEFDVVVTNPPYLVSNKMDEDLKQWLKDSFDGSRDIYAAFIERCLTFAKSDGYASMITMETFMFQYSFRGFRPKLLDKGRFVDTVHLRNRDQGYMDVAFVLTPRASATEPVGKSQFLRLVDVDEPDENKQQDLVDRVPQLRSRDVQEELPTGVSWVNQDRLRKVPRTRFLYWFGDEILGLIDEYDAFDEMADVKVGLQTGDDDRFVRDWWEVPAAERPAYDIEPTSTQRDQGSTPEEPTYRWFSRSGDRNEFLDPTTKLIQWGDDGAPIKNADTDAYVRNSGFYGRPGVTFRLFGTYLMGRYQPTGHYFAHSAHFIQHQRAPDEDAFTRKNMDDVLLAYINSSFARFIVDGFNPGLRYEVGDVKNLPKLPVKNADANEIEELATLARTAVEVQGDRFRLAEKRPIFDPEFFLDKISDLPLVNDQADALIARITALIDSRVFELFDVPEPVQSRVYGSGDLPESVHNRPAPELPGDYGLEPYLDSSEAQRTTLSAEGEDEVVSLLRDRDETDVLELAIQISAEASEHVGPETIARLRSEHDLYTDSELEDRAKAFLSFCVGVAFGRWEIPASYQEAIPAELASEIEDLRGNGFAPITSRGDGYPALADVVEQLVDELGPSVGLDLDDVEPYLVRSVADWLANKFFKKYHCKEYARRGERIPVFIQLGDTDTESSVYVYYHALDQDTLRRLQGMLDTRIDVLEQRLESYEEGERQEVDDIDAIESGLDALINMNEALSDATPEFEHHWEDGIHTLLADFDAYDLLAVKKDDL